MEKQNQMKKKKKKSSLAYRKQRHRRFPPNPWLFMHMHRSLFIDQCGKKTNQPSNLVVSAPSREQEQKHVISLIWDIAPLAFSTIGKEALDQRRLYWQLLFP